MAIKNVHISNAAGKTNMFQTTFCKSNSETFFFEIRHSNQSNHFEATIIKWFPQTNTLFFAIGKKRHKAHIFFDKHLQQFITLKHTDPQTFAVQFLNTLPEKISRSSSKTRFQPAHVLHAPLAGRIVKQLVTEKQFVKKNQQLLIIESMKMENVIRAEADAQINYIAFKEGDIVQTQQKLLSFKFIKE